MFLNFYYIFKHYLSRNFDFKFTFNIYVLSETLYLFNYLFFSIGSF